MPQSLAQCWYLWLPVDTDRINLNFFSQVKNKGYISVSYTWGSVPKRPYDKKGRTYVSDYKMLTFNLTLN